MTKPRTNSTSRYLPAYCLYLLSVYPLRGVGWGCCQSPPRCHWLKTVRQKKKSYLETFVSHKKKKSPHPPHRCERQRQTSDQSSHWLALGTKSNFTHNTAANPKGVHAASPITPPLSHRF